ncbi:RNA polymerase sigma factor [Oceanobacillus jeddahense]|uniref:RNA polymerase sigma factor n=2 Tax=Oceanobacillus jeddahense TaxID=1462527 RepID=A0ABY5JXR9_9BACI|nr:RNA polymerase sigma factor [Oceanobacillus jeddahense]UUI03622.1 RNA polymerase sigma factor [Oceanobacillus jeddahense]
MMKRNEEWMEMYQRGDKTGFTQLYERLHEPLYCFLYRYTQEEQLSIDIVHDTFEILQKKKQAFSSDKGTVKAYLFQIAYRLLINKLNRRKKWRSLLPFLVPQTDHAINIDEKMWVQQAIADLPDKQRAIILLVYYADLPQNEIASILDIPIGTVKSRLHKAMNTLKNDLKEDFHAER